jgi:hypothetical protein
LVAVIVAPEMMAPDASVTTPSSDPVIACPSSSATEASRRAAKTKQSLTMTVSPLHHIFIINGRGLSELALIRLETHSDAPPRDYRTGPSSLTRRRRVLHHRTSRNHAFETSNIDQLRGNTLEQDTSTLSWVHPLSPPPKKGGLGERLVNCRKLMGISQKDLAGQLAVDPCTLASGSDASGSRPARSQSGYCTPSNPPKQILPLTLL